MTEIEILQGIFVLNFLTMLIALGAYILYAYKEGKKEIKESNDRLKETIKQVIKEEKEREEK